jgi:subtilisin-like proprotein convertase family protein
MQRRRSPGILALVFCLAAAAWLWHSHVRRPAADARSASGNAGGAKAVASAQSQPLSKTPATGSPFLALGSHSASNQVARAAAATSPTNHFPYRLSNTTKTLSQLMRDDRAILLANALIDTGSPLNLAIPPSLKAPAQGNGSYVVQAIGPIDNAFRASLAAAGAVIVSYIPNDAYLVRVSDTGAQQLAASAQAVVPYDPYYKLDAGLLALAVQGEPIPPGTALKVTTFPDDTDSTLAAFKQMGIEVLGTPQPSPFGGSIVSILPSTGQLAAVAQMAGVHLVEAAHPRVLANDLFRARLGITTTPVSTTNYLNLTGTNVLVTVADSGVNTNHPNVTQPVFAGNVFAGLGGSATSDKAGHGTHVAGTIAGSGQLSYTVSNAVGSPTNSNFAGMAPGANLLSLNYGDSDASLQQQAGMSNSLISNNSWDYGNDANYDISAASYDAAVRDSLPQVTGPQPVQFVFSAGDSGGGNDDGSGGNPNTVLSPGTAKNVITVGAIEEPRFVTNQMVLPDGSTNEPFLAETDSSNEVASFSARGNVGVGIEGDNGRFKPDLVAPGTMIISDASADWDTNAYYNPTNYSLNTNADNTVGGTNLLFMPPIFIPANAVGVTISVVTNFESDLPFPPMSIYASYTEQPAPSDFVDTNFFEIPTNGFPLETNALLFFSVSRFGFTNQNVNFDVITSIATTNNNPSLHLLQTNLNPAVGPWYRYESGTSMSAAGVSGMLALIQQFWQQEMGLNISPALMKALLINGARPIGAPYDLQVQTTLNSQGWGLPAISNSVPQLLTNLTVSGNSSNAVQLSSRPLQWVDQSPTNVLATGQSETWKVSLSPLGTQLPLRVTLVWTDPPGDPSAGIKLVNNLDLVVTNLDTGEVFFGNDIPSGGVYNEVWDTNTAPPWDVVNNVQNVFLAAPLGTNYTVTVTAPRVNVNAVDSNTNNVVQDFALVLSSGDVGSQTTNAFSFVTAPTITSTNFSYLQVLSNGVPLLNQRVGANSQYSVTNPVGINLNPLNTNGVTNQWDFYVYTNTAFQTNANFTNVAFVTFSPPELGVPREGVYQKGNGANANRPSADVDLYVSTNFALTNLDPNVIATAFAQHTVSVDRSGTQKVLYTNFATPGPYYIGVKSEDQQGGQFSLVGIATDQPFNQQNGQGMFPLTILGSFPIAISPGSPQSPSSVVILAMTTDSATVRRVIVTNTVTDSRFSDLLGGLANSTHNVVLNNHSPFVNSNDLTETFVYDDSGQGDVLGAAYPTGVYAKSSDGPGSLQNFEGDMAANGVWFFTMVDDVAGVGGQIDNVGITIDPQPATNNFDVNNLGSHGSYSFSISVPVNATNLTINVSANGTGQTLGSGIDMYVKFGSLATSNNYDYFALIPPGGGQMVINESTFPPLTPGTYYVEFYNPNPGQVSFNVDYTIGIDTSPPPTPFFLSSSGEPLTDDAVTDSSIFIADSNKVVNVECGVRINHPRESDLVLTLISPKGTRCLLAENRGGLDTNGYGSGYNITNEPVAATNGGPQGATNTFVTGANQGTLFISYNFFSIPDTMHIYYDGFRIFDSGLINGSGTFEVPFGPGFDTNVTIIMDEDNPSTLGDAWQYSVTVVQQDMTYAIFTEDTNKTTTPIKFAVPPFGTLAVPTPVTVFSNSFEDVPASNYAAPFILDGWSVADSNVVTVVTVPAFAPDGTNLLALHTGSLTQSVATVPGQQYRLSFLSHGQPKPAPVSWWQAENNAFDAMGNNNGTAVGVPTYPSGEVGQAFGFNGVNQYVDVVPTNSSLDITSNLTLEAWINMSNVAGNQDIFEKLSGGTNGYQLLMEGSNLVGQVNGQTLSAPVMITAGTWSHVAFTYNQSAMVIYFNGQVVASNAVVAFPIGTNNSDFYIGAGGGPGNFFNGLIDEGAVYSNALSAAEIGDIYAAGNAGKCGAPGQNCVVTMNVIVGGVTNVVTEGNDVWLTNEYTFTATTSNTVIAFQPLENGNELDDIQLFDIPSTTLANYYLPEESLDKFIGENALGNWTLEILDDRLGATNATPTLVSWELNFTFANNKPAPQVLTHGIPVTNCVPTNSMLFFQVPVPAWASFATNLLTNASGNVNLWMNTNMEPVGANPPDFELLNQQTSGTIVLSNNGTPPLIPGTTYYLGVENLGTSPVCFTIEVFYNMITLTNLQLYTNTIPAGNLPQYYQYTVSNTSVAASFELLSNNGNLFLTTRQGPPLPDTVGYDYASQGIGHQSVVATASPLPGSSPVALVPGSLWYLGVFNQASSNVTYVIMGKDNALITNALTNAVPQTNSQVPGIAIYPFYTFDIPDTTNATAALFEVYNMAGNVDLTIESNTYPYIPLGDYPSDTPPFFQSSTQPGTNYEQIVIRSNVLGSPINGTWDLGVPNNELSNVAYTIYAVVATNGILPSQIPITIQVTSPGGPTNGPTLTWPTVDGETYVIFTNANLFTTNWVPLSTNVGQQYYSTFTDPTPITGIRALFYRIAQVPTP